MIPTSFWMSAASTSKMLGRNFLTGSVVAAFVGTAVMIGGNRILQNKFCDFSPSKASPNETMKAISYLKHGDTSVLSYTDDYPRPIPRDDQILIRIKSSSINPCDFKFRRNRMIPIFLFPKPKIPGIDVAGIVVQVGKNVTTKFKVGDHVVALLPAIGLRWGAAAEYTTISESLVGKISIPETEMTSRSSGSSSNSDDEGDESSSTTTSSSKKITFEEAASLPVVSLTTIQAFENVPYCKQIMYQKEDSSSSSPQTQKQQRKVLIHAGAGGVGTFAIQYAKHVLGLYVATTASSHKAQFLKELGADEVIDYHTTNFEDVITDYDIVFDTMSWLYEDRTLNNNRNKKKSSVLRKDGYYINIISSDWSLSPNGLEISNGFTTVWNWIRHQNVFSSSKKNNTTRRSRPNYVTVAVEPNGQHMQMAIDLLQQGKVHAVIDRKFPLTDTIQAYDYLEQGHATGKVILVH